jgi:hypothetical protein
MVHRLIRKTSWRSNEIDAFASNQFRVDPKLYPARPDANGKEIHGVIKR